MKLSKPITCCNGCIPPKRYVGCHGVCEEFITQKKEQEEYKEKVKAKKLTESYHHQASVNRVYRSKDFYKKGNPQEN